MSLETQQKLTVLSRILREQSPLAIGLSGGVDSTFLAAAARRAAGPGGAALLLAVSPSLSQAARIRAHEVAALLEMDLVEASGGEFDNPDYRSNAPDRCFHCKADLFRLLEGLARERGLKTLAYGANADDGSDFRPGHRAALAAGARAPLAEVGLTKAEIRLLSREWGLPTWDLPASPCLSSRIPHGQPIREEDLRQVENAESWLTARGFPVNRVRHRAGEASIELPAGEMARFDPHYSDAQVAFKALGFTGISLDERGFRSGSLNEILTSEEKAKALGMPVS